MEKHAVFCTKDCLLHIFEEFDNKRLESENPNDLLLATNLYSFLTNQTFLTLNIKSDELIALSSNIYIKTLIKNSSSKSKTQLDYRPDFFEEEENIKNTPTNAIFLLDKSKEECEKLEQQYGLMFLCKENIFQKAGFMFSWALYNVTKDSNAKKRFESWSEAKNLQHPFNSMLIIDNYILDDNEGIDENLIPFLDNFLPQKLENQDFELTIITNNKKGKSDFLKKKHDEISKALNKIRTYKFHLYFLTTDADKNHDRNIFTNYLWLHSGHSFTYFRNNRVTKTTTLMVFPIFYQQQEFQSYYKQDFSSKIEKQSSVLEAVNQLLKEAKTIFDTTEDLKIAGTTTVLEKKTFGTKQNRLLQ